MDIYFAFSIRGGQGNRKIYGQILQYLSCFGNILTKDIREQGTSLTGTNIPDHKIFERDMVWLKSCDIVIADVSAPSLGVGYELAIAEKEGKPILCLCHSNTHLSAMISGNANLTIKKYTTFDEVKEHITSFISERFLDHGI